VLLSDLQLVRIELHYRFEELFAVFRSHAHTLIDDFQVEAAVGRAVDVGRRHADNLSISLLVSVSVTVGRAIHLDVIMRVCHQVIRSASSGLLVKRVMG
jgi:hypothetical protein